SHVVDALISEGHEVRVLDLRPPVTELSAAWRGVQFLRGSLLDAHALEDATRGCNYVFQYATTTIPKTSIEDPELDNQNLVGTLRLVQACHKAKVEKIVFPSSGGTLYGKPDRLPIPEDHVFNVGSGRGTSIRELFATMAKVIGDPFEPLRASPLPGDEPACVLDTRRIRRAVGWQPVVNLETGLRRTWEWIQLAKP